MAKEDILTCCNLMFVPSSAILWCRGHSFRGAVVVAIRWSSLGIGLSGLVSKMASGSKAVDTGCSGSASLGAGMVSQTREVWKSMI